jgi:hypothetical protein
VQVRVAKAVEVGWEERGPKMWAELHARPATYTGDAGAELQWLGAFARRIGCGECQKHWRELAERMPPDLASGVAYHRWTVDAHNAVNVRLGKPVWTPTDQPV